MPLRGACPGKPKPKKRPVRRRQKRSRQHHDPAEFTAYEVELLRPVTLKVPLVLPPCLQQADRYGYPQGFAWGDAVLVDKFEDGSAMSKEQGQGHDFIVNLSPRVSTPVQDPLSSREDTISECSVSLFSAFEFCDELMAAQERAEFSDSLLDIALSVARGLRRELMQQDYFEQEIFFVGWPIKSEKGEGLTV